jgi:hypothetical protein
MVRGVGKGTEFQHRTRTHVTRDRDTAVLHIPMTNPIYGTDRSIIVALCFISVKFPELVCTAVKVPDHAGFFRFGVKGSYLIARCRQKIQNSIHNYIYICHEILDLHNR